ncbi:hypothetical protein CL656_02195 [bacterium]|nr:hypothetical protein [bacterium]
MNNTNKNSWYFNKSHQLGGTHLNLIYKRTKAPFEEGFINGIEYPGDILITEENKSAIISKILKVLSETNNKNKLFVFNSSLECSVDFPVFLIDSLKDIKLLQNLEVSGFFNPFDLSMLTMYKGEKRFFSDSSNAVFIELLCPYGFEGGNYKAPGNIDSLNVKSSDRCSYAGRRVHFEMSDDNFVSPCEIEADQFNYGTFRNVKKLSCGSNFASVKCYDVDSVLLGTLGESEIITMDFNSLSLRLDGQDVTLQDRVDLNWVGDVVLGYDVTPRVLNINNAYLPSVNKVRLNAGGEYFSRFPFLTNTSDEVQ